jgi:hypothetical protein
MPKSSKTKRRTIKSRTTRKNKTKTARRYPTRGGLEVKKNRYVIFSSPKLSTQPCNNPNYRRIGIVHLSDSIGINFLRNNATELFNAFGSKGFDNSIYDQLRDTCFRKLAESINENQQICNIRVDIDRDASLIYMHVYGTLFELKNLDK